MSGLCPHCKNDAAAPNSDYCPSCRDHVEVPAIIAEAAKQRTDEYVRRVLADEEKQAA